MKSKNIMGKKAVTDQIKNQVIGLHLSNKSSREISKLLLISKTCVLNTIAKYKQFGNIKEKKKPGRPPKTSNQEDRLIYRFARDNPRISLKKLCQKYNCDGNATISKSTMSRRLIQRGLCSYVAARKPLLKTSDLIKRKQFCRKILNMSHSELRKIVFSDESNFELFNRKMRVHVRRFSSEKYSARMLTPRVQGGGGSIGIWGCITYDGPGIHTLYSGRLDRFRYIEILENALIPTANKYFGDDLNWTFQQDNAPCHTA